MSPPFDEGQPAEVVLPSAGESETLVRASGTRFLVTTRHGDVAPKGARELGLFFEDTRYLSHYQLSVRNRSLVHLSDDTNGAAANQIDLMISGLVDQEFLDDPQNFLHIRRLQLLDTEFSEQISFTNYVAETAVVEVEIAFDVDFIDIFEARGARRTQRGVHAPPLVDEQTVRHHYRGRDGRTYVADFHFDPPPDELHERSARFRLVIPSGSRKVIEVRLRPSNTRSTAVTARPFSTRIAEARERAEEYLSTSTRFLCDSGPMQGVLDQSITDLHSLELSLESGTLLGAGIPWYCCPFGRDSLLAAYEALTVHPKFASGALRVLAAHQGTKYDNETEEEPGKIFHELRFGEMARASEVPHSPYYGSIDATPLFLIVLDATYCVTSDLGLVKELHGNILRALEWLDQKSECGTSFVTYARRSPRGLDNQGWKDSKAGVSFPNGERAKAPIALAEVQGYAVDAYRRGARLLAVLGDSAHAEIYGSRGHLLRELIEEELWLKDAGRYAFAVDAAGRKLDTVVSNVGHLLWSRVPSEERARRTADRLLAKDSFSGFGIRTLAAHQPVYNPLSYHNGTIWPHDNALIAKGMANYHLADQTCDVFEGLIAAMSHFRERRLPELFCGMNADQGVLVRYPVACSPQAWASAAPFLLLQATLGLHLDAPGKRLSIRNPRLPTSLKRLEIRDLRVGRSRVSLRFRKIGKRCHVDRLDVVGEPLLTQIEIA